MPRSLARAQATFFSTRIRGAATAVFATGASGLKISSEAPARAAFRFRNPSLLAAFGDNAAAVGIFRSTKNELDGSAARGYNHGMELMTLMGSNRWPLVAALALGGFSGGMEAARWLSGDTPARFPGSIDGPADWGLALWPAAVERTVPGEPAARSEKESPSPFWSGAGSNESGQAASTAAVKAVRPNVFAQAAMLRAANDALARAKAKGPGHEAKRAADASSMSPRRKPEFKLVAIPQIQSSSSGGWLRDAVKSPSQGNAGPSSGPGLPAAGAPTGKRPVFSRGLAGPADGLGRAAGYSGAQGSRYSAPSAGVQGGGVPSTLSAGGGTMMTTAGPNQPAAERPGQNGEKLPKDQKNIPYVHRKPSITLTKPQEGASFTVPQPITLEAEAHAAEGKIDKVEFYYEGGLIGRVKGDSGTFTYTWSNAPAGLAPDFKHQIWAVATDDSGQEGSNQDESQTVTITVKGPPPPRIDSFSVACASPCKAPAKVSLSATASAGAGAVIKKIEFASDPSVVNRSCQPDAATASCSKQVSDVEGGDYEFTVTVTDDQGESVTKTADLTVERSSGGGGTDCPSGIGTRDGGYCVPPEYVDSIKQASGQTLLATAVRIGEEIKAACGAACGSAVGGQLLYRTMTAAGVGDSQILTAATHFLQLEYAGALAVWMSALLQSSDPAGVLLDFLHDDLARAGIVRDDVLDGLLGLLVSKAYGQNAPAGLVASAKCRYKGTCANPEAPRLYSITPNVLQATVSHTLTFLGANFENNPNLLIWYPDRNPATDPPNEVWKTQEPAIFTLNFVNSFELKSPNLILGAGTMLATYRVAIQNPSSGKTSNTVTVQVTAPPAN